MKQLLIATTLITAFTCHGQGTLGFSAGSSAATRIATNSTFGGPSTGLISGGIGSYYFALFVAPNGASTGYSTSASLDPTQNGFTLVSSPSGPYATNSALGRFNGNPTPTDPMTINGYATGSSADFVVVGWSANVAGPDWSSFLAWWNNGNVTGPVGWAAHSSVATGIQLGGGTIPAGTIFGVNPGQVPGFTLQMIPEPSAFAIAVLGGAVALLQRSRRKLLVSTAAFLGAASIAFSQGTVDFHAGSSLATRIATNSTIGGPSTGLISGANSYYFALFIAPSTVGTGWGSSTSMDPTTAGFSLVSSPSGPYGTNSAAVGRFTGNPSGTDPLTVNGYATSSSANFVVVGWSANIAGPNWNAFLTWWNNGNINGPGGWIGHSLVADQVQLGGGPIPAGGIFGANTGQIPGFTLQLSVPEPSGLALAGLAGASVLIFRRRKA